MVLHSQKPTPTFLQQFGSLLRGCFYAFHHDMFLTLLILHRAGAGPGKPGRKKPEAVRQPEEC